jgi:hypothetical protein
MNDFEVDEGTIAVLAHQVEHTTAFFGDDL